MANLNKVFLLGNLTRDPELKHTATGAAVCNFSIAVNRSFKQGDEWKKEVQFINIVAWSKLGENCAKFLVKGKPVLVEGRLVIRSYEADDGSKKYVTEIVAENVQFLSSGGGTGENQTGFSHSDPAASGDDESVPF